MYRECVYGAQTEYACMCVCPYRCTCGGVFVCVKTVLYRFINMWTSSFIGEAVKCKINKRMKIRGIWLIQEVGTIVEEGGIHNLLQSKYYHF